MVPGRTGRSYSRSYIIERGAPVGGGEARGEARASAGHCVCLKLLGSTRIYIPRSLVRPVVPECKLYCIDLELQIVCSRRKRTK